MKRAIACVLLVAFGLGLALAGDDADRARKVEDLIGKGLKAYREGRPDEAIEHLQNAINLIRRATSGGGGFADFLPEPAEGWTAGKPDVNTTTGASAAGTVKVTIVDCTYERQADQRKVDVMITDSPQLTEGPRRMLEMLKNPQMAAMLQRDPNTKVKPFEDKPWVGMVRTEKGGDCQVLAVTDRLMVTIQVDAADEKLAMEFWKRIDRKGLAEATAAKK